jgi:hypothetical protein
VKKSKPAATENNAEFGPVAAVENAVTVVAVAKPIKLLPYPTEVWAETLYGEYAIAMSRGNFIPPEFFIESLKTIVGAIAGDRVQGPGKRDGVNLRQFTVIIGFVGRGKGSAIRDTLAQFTDLPDSQNDFVRNIGVTNPWSHIGAVKSNAGSEVGLYEAGKACQRVLLTPTEFDELLGKIHIENSGLQATLRELFDSTWFTPSITAKRKAKDVPPRMLLSLLTSTQPDTWDSTVSLHGGAGSGFLSRLTLISNEESRTVATLEEPQLGDWERRMFERLTRLKPCRTDSRCSETHKWTPKMNMKRC